MINLRMSSFSFGPIVFQSVVPEEFSSHLIPGAEIASAEGDYGKIFFQEIHAGDITVIYKIYQIKEDLALDFQFTPGMLQAHIALKNDCHYYVRGIGEVYLAEGQFNLLDAPYLEGTVFLEQGKEYRSIHIIFSPAFIEKLLPFFHHFEEWLTSDSTEPRLLFNIHSWLSPQLKDIVDRILHCYFPDEVQGFYRELKISEFLSLALAPVNGETNMPVKLTRRNIALIHESKNILDKSFGEHITVAAVAHQAGLSEMKLKAGFKQVFGISLFDYLMKTRMQVARELLLETDKPIKEIAALTGYATKQSFLNAFKKYFHDTPGSFRKI